MARTALAVQDIIRGAGLLAVYTAATVDGHAWDNSSGKVFLHVKNGGASPITVTIAIPKTVDGLAITDLSVTVANATDRLIGPFPAAVYEQVSTVPVITQAVLVNTSAQTSVNYAAIRLP